MPNALPHSHVLAYEQAAAALSRDPGNTEQQRLAILNLARAGSLDFAMSEYKRYGLDKVSGNEDVMALGARLSKDMFLATSGSKAKQYAKESAAQYKTAYEETGGYYSGINAATMALLGGAPEADIRGQAQAVLARLPELVKLTPEDIYYVEATRAEANLLLGNREDAMEGLIKALIHDPLNYTAHATTLKQFHMILGAQSASDEWLAAYASPGSLHFAGHMFGTKRSKLSNKHVEALTEKISDMIQQEDIGFGYGALAAGADIVFAEALLNEGAELHVILPVPVETFLDKSVRPYGDDWEARFQRCMKNATDIIITSEAQLWPDPDLNSLAGKVAIGQAFLRADQLSTRTLQGLIWDGRRDGSYTAQIAADWTGKKSAQFTLEYPENRGTRNASVEHSNRLQAVMWSGGTPVATFNSMTDAAQQALGRMAQSQERIGIHFGHGVLDEDLEARANILALYAAPHSIVLSESAASVLAAEAPGLYQLSYIGRTPDDQRAYTMTPKRTAI